MQDISWALARETKNDIRNLWGKRGIQKNATHTSPDIRECTIFWRILLFRILGAHPLPHSCIPLGGPLLLLPLFAKSARCCSAGSTLRNLRSDRRCTRGGIVEMGDATAGSCADRESRLWERVAIGGRRRSSCWGNVGSAAAEFRRVELRLVVRPGIWIRVDGRLLRPTNRGALWLSGERFLASTLDRPANTEFSPPRISSNLDWPLSDSPDGMSLCPLSFCRGGIIMCYFEMCREISE